MKTEHTIECPSCRHVFEPTAALAGRLRADLTRELELDFSRRLTGQREALAREITASIRAETARAHAGRLAELEAAVADREAAVQNANRRLEGARREAGERAATTFAAERRGMEAELERERAVAKELRLREVAVRQELRRLETLREELTLENTRVLAAERARLRGELTQAHAEAQEVLKEEHEQQNAALRRQIEDLQRRLASGGEQRRGEAVEVRLEAYLRSRYPGDVIEPVNRGVHGADVTQRVQAPGPGGQCDCGVILWEAKHTTVWQPRWIGKLKDDQRAARAEVAVIVTATLPRDVTTFALLDGVWVTGPGCLAPLSLALRVWLVQLAAMQRAAAGRGEKKEVAYAYLTGPRFQGYVQTLTGIFGYMGTDLAAEQRAMNTLWNKRATQIERLSDAVTGLWGDLQAIVGGKEENGGLPGVPALELETLVTGAGRMGRQPALPM